VRHARELTDPAVLVFVDEPPQPAIAITVVAATINGESRLMGI
jgi:hypothetical protein